MRLKRTIQFYVFVFMLFAVGCLAKEEVAKASNTLNVSLTPDKVYQYDVNEDGLTDKVKVKVVNNEDEEYSGVLKIYVNEDIVFEQKRNQDPVWYVQLIRVENGKVFFDIFSTIASDDACMHQLYSCQNGKLKSVYNFQKYYNKYADYYLVNIVKVSGNTIKTSVMAQFYVTGRLQFDMKVIYKDGTFKRTSSSFAPKYTSEGRKNKWTVNRKIKVYKKAGSTKLAYTLKKGNVVKLNKVVYKGNKVYFQVKKSNGKTGYIAATKKMSSTFFFKEAQFAG